MIVSFFGHSDTPSSVSPSLEKAIQQIIDENENVTFYVGTNGAFDRMVQSVLDKFSKIYSHIEYYIVLAYLPIKEDDYYDGLPTIFPEGIENVPKRFAIDFRNKFMVNECDTVICYVWHVGGGARKFMEMAKKKRKTILNLADEG